METIMKRQGIVKANSNAAQGLRDLFEVELKDMYWAEKAMLAVLKKMSQNACSPDLIRALKNHLNETEEHISRLQRTFEAVGCKIVARKSEAIEGLIKECEIIMKGTELGDVRDAGIIAAAQKMEHYEIATYGTLHAFAVTLGEEKAEELMALTLNDEKKINAELTKIALKNINADAADLDDEW
jgi:ferritin-like metal-binding protein YciE